jgi:Flp pilus assembly protein TadG
MTVERAKGKNEARGFLTRLARDRRGNTLAMMAMAVVPLCGFAGSAVDASRLYFVKARLQAACDAGALAGRKFMTDTNFTADAQAKAEAFFDNNFKVGTFGTTSRTRAFSKTATNQVQGDATAVVPMTLMRMFGSPEVTLTVTCEAKLEVPNMDVMFVLDTTGSMGDTNPGDSVSRIAALRTAVGNFYDTLEAAKVGTSRIRYGFVPYSSTVNVGLLLRREWMVDSWTYQSREPADITQSTSTSTQGAWLTANGPQTITGTNVRTTSYGNPENCVAPANTRTSSNAGTTGYTTQPDGSRTRTVVTTYNGLIYSVSLSNGVCTINKDTYTNYRVEYVETQTPNPNAGQSTTTTSNVYWWNYKPVTYNLTALKGTLGTGLMAGGRITPTLSGGGSAIWSARNVDWVAASACIEERDTVRQSTYTTIPSAAYDLDIDLVPTAGNPATQWRPFIPALVYARSWGSYSNPSVTTTSWPADPTATVRTTSGYVNLSSYPNDYGACPSAAKKLGTITKSALTTYMTGLKVAGRTYHDIGFLWGLRLLSAEGIFGSENTTAPNGSAIARHVIFMTDGDTETNFADYDAYGLAALDRRRTPANRLPTGDAEQDTIVENRLSALCLAAQRKNMTVWVIAFGTSLTTLLSNCATPGGHSFQANNATELNTAFATIASNIAKLRISK